MLGVLAEIRPRWRAILCLSRIFEEVPGFRHWAPESSNCTVSNRERLPFCVLPRNSPQRAAEARTCVPSSERYVTNPEDRQTPGWSLASSRAAVVSSAASCLIRMSQVFPECGLRKRRPFSASSSASALKAMSNYCTMWPRRLSTGTNGRIAWGTLQQRRVQADCA